MSLRIPSSLSVTEKEKGRMRRKGIIFFLLVLLSFFNARALAQQWTSADISASVEVKPVFFLSVDKSYLDFGIVEPGQTKILGEGSYFNQVRCRSNYGRAWYVKAHLASLPKLVVKDYSLPAEVFKYKISQFSGKSQPSGKVQFTQLQTTPGLIYASQGDDNAGSEVVLRFQYSFTVPWEAITGNYQAQITFTMAEAL